MRTKFLLHKNLLQKLYCAIVGKKCTMAQRDKKNGREKVFYNYINENTTFSWSRVGKKTLYLFIFLFHSLVRPAAGTSSSRITTTTVMSSTTRPSSSLIQRSHASFAIFSAAFCAFLFLPCRKGMAMSIAS